MGVIAGTAEVHHVAYIVYLDSYHHVHSLPLLPQPTVTSHAVACLNEHTHRARASQLPPMGVIARTAEVHHVAYMVSLYSYYHVHSLPLLPQPTVASHAIACLTEHAH